MKVIIIDDKKAMHYILELLLAPIEGLEVVGRFCETASAYDYIRTHGADLAFVDIELPRENGLAFAHRLREQGYGLHLIFVTSHKEFALPAFEVYAYDYLVKPIAAERLHATVKRAIRQRDRGIAEAQSVAASAVSVTQAGTLTPREIEVLTLMSEGLTNKQIAQQLFIIEGTVKNHIANLFAKLDVKNRVQAVAVARERKLLP